MTVLNHFLSVLVAEEFARMRADINTLKAQIGVIMNTIDDFRAKMKEFDAATNEIASDLTDLRAQLAAMGTVVPDEVLTTLDAKIATLVALGKDPVT